MSDESRSVGVIAVIVKDRSSATLVNKVTSEFGDSIIGRMGLPYYERNLNIITLIVDATTDAIGAFTGKIGQIPNVTVKATLAKV
ncbi:MAG TPA: TM1266 family iron-only hydrogenase system putative regulator [Treponemataceae bacterium]|nr:TM1266 family iron-only hydrogenase system putative regulator [Treponemataceae bacterium]